MAPPMLQITTDDAAASPARAKAHLLPCRIHHTGPVGATDLFWAPKDEGKERPSAEECGVAQR